MAKPHQRVFALVTAVLFLATSVATGVLVVMQIRKDNEQQKITEGLQQAQQQQQAQQTSSEGKTLEGFTPVATVDSLQIVDLTVGDGEEVKTTDTVTAHYTGALAKDGTIFESSKDSGQPATFPLGQVIQGWQQGVPGMKVGGTRRLIIPASLAYGEAGSPPTIGPNEPLVFDIELIAISQQ
jgi:FKBP-type peptidyl-prolyl cis-trans isomerase